MRIQITDSIRNSTIAFAVPSGKNPVSLGKATTNDVVLPTNVVPDSAALIFNDGSGEGWKFRPLCSGWIFSNELIQTNQVVRLKQNQPMQIGHFSLAVSLESTDAILTVNQRRSQLESDCGSIIADLHSQLVSILHEDESYSSGEDVKPTEDAILRVEQLIAVVAESHPRLPGPSRPMTEWASQFASQFIRSRLLHLVVAQNAEQSEQDDENRLYGGQWSRLRCVDRDKERFIEQTLRQLLITLKVDARGDLSEQIRKIETEFSARWTEAVERVPLDTLRYLYLAEVRRQIKDIMYGLGPLEDLLEDPSINEIMVNDANNIYIEKNGEIENSGRRFVKDVMFVINRIVDRVQRNINISEPMVDARLPDGSRVNAVIKPITVGGPCLTIRRFPASPLTIAELVRRGSLSGASRDFLKAAVEHRCNILVAGGTATGKTTLLNALSEFIPDKERILTVEDTAELRLTKSHVVSLEARQKNLAGKGEIDIRMLVRNALRMRPSRIIVGECRGGEALDMLQAMNTGHDGSMTTIHANNPSDVFSRLEVMVQQASQSSLPIESIRQQIGSALDLIVQLRVEEYPNPDRPTGYERRRVVSEISEVLAASAEYDDIHVRPLFFRPPGGTLQPTGYLPTFIDELVNNGLLKIDKLLAVNA